MTWGVIDDDSIAEAEALVGVPLRRDSWRWVTEATKDAISHFAEGVGDDNPLWTDPEYGKASSWGTNLAPPCFLFAVDGTTVAPKLAGVQWIYAGCDWVWNDVIRRGDEFKVASQVTAVERKSSSFAKLWVMQSGRVDYFRPDGTMLAVANSKIARTPRGDQLARASNGKPKYEVRQTQRYTHDELDAIEEQALNEPRRGAGSRFWEDVEIGDDVPAVVKGPLTGTDLVGWYSAVQGARPYGGTSELVYKYRRRHADFHINPETGARDSAGRGHLEVQTGVDVGMGGAYDIGPHRIAWCGHLMTNWMGDDGFLRRLSVEVRRPVLLGDTLWWKGVVTGKEVVHGYHCVHVDVTAVTQRDEKVSWGSADVYLPSCEHGPVVLPVPVRS
jgi:acyl dehydratase